MKRTSKQLTARLLQLRNAIKRKYKMFKEGAVESDIMLEKQYKPIVEELRKNTVLKEEDQKSFKKEPKEEEGEEMDYSTDEEEFTPEIVSTPKPRNISELVSSPSGFETASKYLQQHFENKLTQQYMRDLLKDAGGAHRKIDHEYGPRFEGETLMVGDKKLDFDKKGNILIGGVKYGTSEGLYELLFKRTPSIYEDSDLKTYKSILIATNAHKENYKYEGKIKRNKNIKYQNIIKHLFPTAQGRGMVWKMAKSSNIIHWNDPNELVERLNHIAMSTESGNRVHRNEIISIMEELREAGYIKGLGNSRFKALLH